MRLAWTLCSLLLLTACDDRHEVPSSSGSDLLGDGAESDLADLHETALPASATGTVFVVDYEYQADLRVYLADYDYQAECQIWVADYDYQANNESKWFFVDYEYQAELKIFFVDYEYQADLTIFYVDYEYQAGCQ